MTSVKNILVALVFLLGATKALAVPILVTSGGDTIGINSLDVNGVLYNVSWQEGSYNAVFGSDTPTFLGDSTGAQDAANAIISFFNGQSVEPIDLGGGLACSSNSFDCDLVVPWAAQTTTFDAFNVDWAQSSGPWVLQSQTWSRNFDNDLVAMALFDITVPLPTTLALFGLGLVGLGLAKRKKA